MVLAIAELVILILLEIGLTPASFVNLFKHEIVVTNPAPAGDRCA
jgi:hypothetical protein